MKVTFLESKTGKQYILETEVIPRAGEAVLINDKNYGVKGVAHRFKSTVYPGEYTPNWPVVSIELL